MKKDNSLLPYATILLASNVVGCDAFNKIKDALDGEPQTSYCEALCDWAVTCAEGESSLGPDEMMDACLSDTRASDPKCADAEAGELSVDKALILTECTNSVIAMECNGLTGSETEVGSARPPELMCIAGYGGVDDPSSIDFNDPAALADIDSYATFNAARNAVMKTGDELCDEVSWSICDSLIGCAAGMTGTEGSDEVEAVMEECQGIFGEFTSNCKDNGLYDQTLPLDLNLTRWMADDCVEGLATVDACDLTGWPLDCAGAFVPVDGGEDLYDVVLGAAGQFIGVD